MFQIFIINNTPLTQRIMADLRSPVYSVKMFTFTYEPWKRITEKYMCNDYMNEKIVAILPRHRIIWIFISKTFIPISYWVLDCLFCHYEPYYNNVLSVTSDLFKVSIVPHENASHKNTCARIIWMWRFWLSNWHIELFKSS